MNDKSFDPCEYFNDSLLVTLSVRYPIQYKYDLVYGFQWKYRCGGTKISEAIVMIAGSYESTNTYVYLLDKIISYGYRAFIIDMGAYDKFKQLAKGFDQFCSQNKINKVHLLGSDMGGFIALQIASYSKLEVQVKSLIIINTPMSLDVFKKPSFMFSILSNLSSRSILKKEVEQMSNYNTDTKNTAVYINKELDLEPSEVLSARIRLRSAKPMPINIKIPNEAVMSVEVNDRDMEESKNLLPSSVFPCIKHAMMARGGNWPQVCNPDGLMQYILVHLQKWTEKSNLEKTDDKGE